MYLHRWVLGVGLGGYEVYRKREEDFGGCGGWGEELSVVFDQVMTDTAVHSCDNDPELQAYRETAAYRLRLGNAWFASDEKEARVILEPDALPVPQASQPSTPQLTAQGVQGSSPVKSPEAKDANAEASAAAQNTSETEKTSAQASPAREPGTEAKSSDEKKDPKDQANAKDETDADAKSVAVSQGSQGSGKKSKRLPGSNVSEILRGVMKSKSILVVQDTDALWAQRQMHLLQEKILVSKTMDELEETKQFLQNSIQQTKMLAAAMNKSANNLSGHVRNQERKQSREEERKRRLEESKAVEEARNTARKAAKQVKEEDETIPALFQVILPELVDNKIATNFTVHDGKIEKFNIDEPAMFINMAFVEEWQKAARMQVALGNFGGKYKKAECFLKEKKAQLPLYTKEGKEETAEMMMNFMDAVPKDNRLDVTGDFAKILDTVWLFGMDPKLRSLGNTPNSMAMFKTLVHGEVKVMAFEAASLVAALRQELKKDVIAYDDLIDKLTHYGATTLELMAKNGAKICVGTIQASQTFYVPQGWLVLEQPVKGVLIYGCRKTTLFKSEAGKRAYEAMVGLHAASDRSSSVANMQKVLKMIQDDGDD